MDVDPMGWFWYVDFYSIRNVGIYIHIPRIMYIDPIGFGKKKHVCGPLGFPWQLFC